MKRISVGFLYITLLFNVPDCVRGAWPISLLAAPSQWVPCLYQMPYRELRALSSALQLPRTQGFGIPPSGPLKRNVNHPPGMPCIRHGSYIASSIRPNLRYKCTPLGSMNCSPESGYYNTEFWPLRICGLLDSTHMRRVSTYIAGAFNVSIALRSCAFVRKPLSSVPTFGNRIDWCSVMTCHSGLTAICWRNDCMQAFL